MEAAMTLTQVLLEEAEATYTITERLFRRVADEQLSWTPATGKTWMTVGQLLMHCASFGCGKAIQGFVKGDWGLPEGLGVDALTTEDHVPPVVALPSVVSVEQALELLAKDRSLAVSCIAAAGEGNLLGRRVAAPWGGAEVSLFQHLLHIIAHLAQHKGQLFYYLKLMGKDVDTSDLWGA
jgi:uncharacterized damage-inducible protein DinB